MHIFPFYSLKSPKRWQAMARSRDHHCVSATIGLEGFSTTRYVLYAKNCTSHWIVPPLRGWPESTVWGCVCLLTLILPAEADLTVVSGTLHGRWGSESIKGKKKEEQKNGKYLAVEDPLWPKIASNPPLLVRFWKVSSHTGLMRLLCKTLSFLSFHGNGIVTDYCQTVPSRLFSARICSSEPAIWTSQKSFDLVSVSGFFPLCSPFLPAFVCWLR